MVTLTKKQLWKENDEWVVVGSKREKPELGWVVVPSHKSKPAPTDEPDRVDKILARYVPRPPKSIPDILIFQTLKAVR